MKITFTQHVIQNGVLIITSWEGDYWCNVYGLSPEKQTSEEIARVKKRMGEQARLPGAPRNGRRTVTKC